MRILFLSNLYPPNVVGGYERLCFEAARGLSARGHQVTVLTSNYGGKIMDIAGQTVVRSLRLFATQEDIYKPFACTAEQRASMNAHNAEQLDATIAQSQP